MSCGKKCRKCSKTCEELQKYEKLIPPMTRGMTIGRNNNIIYTDNSYVLDRPVPAPVNEYEAQFQLLLQTDLLEDDIRFYLDRVYNQMAFLALSQKYGYSNWYVARNKFNKITSFLKKHPVILKAGGFDEK